MTAIFYFRSPRDCVRGWCKEGEELSMLKVFGVAKGPKEGSLGVVVR